MDTKKNTTSIFDFSYTEAERKEEIQNMKNIQIPEFEEIIFKERTHKYCLLIPLFNEGKRFLSQVKKMQTNGVFDSIDVIICDAGSSDGTTDPKYLKKSGFTAILIRNGLGRYSTDLRMGYYWSIKKGYSGFITVDGNDKDDTVAIPDFINKLDDGYDYIQGSRYVSGGHAIHTPFIRHWALKLIIEPGRSICARKHLTDTTNGFRAYSLKFLLDDRVLPFRNVFYGYELIYYLPVRACRLGFRVVEIPVIRAYPKGKTPTKVGGIRGNVYQLSILWKIILNFYNPKRKYRDNRSDRYR